MNNESTPAWSHGRSQRWQTCPGDYLPEADRERTSSLHPAEIRLYDLDQLPLTNNRASSIARTDPPPPLPLLNPVDDPYKLPQVTRPFRSQLASQYAIPSGPSSSTNLPNAFHQVPAPPSTAGIIARCFVCEGTNGPWRRGPLGVRTLCNSCGHIKNSAQQPTSYDEAIALLEGLRLARLARVKRRHDINEVGDLLQRLERLPTATIDLARARFPAGSHTEGNIQYRETPAVQQPFSLPSSQMGLGRMPNLDYLPPLQPQPRRLSTSLSLAPPNERNSAIYPIIRLEPPTGSRFPAFDPSSAASSSSGSFGQLPWQTTSDIGLPPFPAHPDPFRLSASRSTSPSRYAFDTYRESQARPSAMPFDSREEQGMYADNLSRPQTPPFQQRRRYTSAAGTSQARPRYP